VQLFITVFLHSDLLPGKGFWLLFSLETLT